MQMEEWIKKTNTCVLRKLAKEVGVHPHHIYHIAKTRPSPGLAKKIDRATRELTPDMYVTKEELRPDIWGEDD